MADMKTRGGRRVLAGRREVRRRPASLRLLRDAWQDLRYATRTIVRQPGIAAAAVLTIALGVGASSAIFSIVHGVLLTALPFRDAERLYRLTTIHADGRVATELSPPDFVGVRDTNRVFSRVDAYTGGVVTMLGGGEPREVRVVSVSDGLFALLDLRVAVGRGFVAEEHAPGRPDVAVLDHGFWRGTFGGDEHAIGKSIVIGGIPYAIVGVLAPGGRLPADVPGARVPSDADVYLPLEYGDAFNAAAVAPRRTASLGVFASARSGLAAARIDEELRRISRERQTAFPQTNNGLTIAAIPARDFIVGDVRRPLLMLLGAAGFVLLIACANVANLVLARASARGEELAVRAALGARRGRLVRQLLVEALVLGVAGGALGLALAYVATTAVVAAQPADIPRLEEITLDRTVVLFTLATTLVASVVFGALPALQVTRQLTPGLRTARGGPDRHTRRMRAGLIVAEVALAVVLLAGAGLLLRSLIAQTQVAPGFAADKTMAFRVALFGRGYDLDRVRGRVTELEAALQRFPGVTSAAATSVLPLSGPGPLTAFALSERSQRPRSDIDDVQPQIGVASVTPDYLEAIGASVVSGRAFTNRDDGRAPLVAIVNEAASRRWFPDRTPIGQRVEMNGTREIVGVMADVLQGAPTQPAAPQLLVPYAQRPARSVWMVVHTAVDPATVASSLRATIQRFDANLAVSPLTMIDELQAGALARPRFYASVLALFAGAALALAITGIFGVMSQIVAERTREIGVRLALGAHPTDVLGMIVGRAVALASIGAAIGLAVAAALGRLIQAHLFGVYVLDPPTFGLAITILLIGVAAASALPARRAARLDPASTLRRG